MNNAVIAVSVCLCGGLGAAARYVCDSVIKASWHKAFPLSTFVINSIAGFLAGVIAGLYSRRFLSDPAHVMLATGFLGGFSTFSTMMNRVRGICADVGGGSCDGRGIGILPCRLRLERGR